MTKIKIITIGQRGRPSCYASFMEYFTVFKAYEWVQLGSLHLIIIIDFLIFIIFLLIIGPSVALISQKMHYLADFIMDLWYFLGYWPLIIPFYSYKSL